MKSQILISAFLLVLTISKSRAFSVKDGEPNDILIELSNSIKAINAQYKLTFERKESVLRNINFNLASSSSLEEKVNLLILKNQIEDQITQLKLNNFKGSLFKRFANYQNTL
jgi:hypothetical protein